MNETEQAEQKKDETVASETIDSNKIITRPALMIGWNDKGEFLWGVMDANISLFHAFKLTSAAAREIEMAIPSDRGPVSKVQGVGAMPPGLKGIIGG